MFLTGSPAPQQIGFLWGLDFKIEGVFPFFVFLTRFVMLMNNDLGTQQVYLRTSVTEHGVFHGDILGSPVAWKRTRFNQYRPASGPKTRRRPPVQDP